MKVGIRRLDRRRRSLGLAAILLVIGFAALELYERIRMPWPYRADVYDEKGKLVTRDLDDQLLGYVPPANQHFHMRGYFKDRLVVDFSYSIDKNGLRVSSSSPEVRSGKCILFFGGSTPFGEGVPDDQTIPYFVAAANTKKYILYNFGYFYYGGHQMLAIIETKLLDKIIECEPAYAIYFGYVAHAKRAKRLETKPRYVFNDEGVPVLDARSEALLNRIVASSRVLRKLDRLFAGDVGRDEADLYVKIIDKARLTLESRYPGVEFHVIFWDQEGVEISEYLSRSLFNIGITVHLISEIFPHYDYNTMRYSLGPEYMVNDVTWHINGRGYRTIAEYIASRIVD